MKEEINVYLFSGMLILSAFLLGLFSGAIIFGS